MRTADHLDAGLAQEQPQPFGHVRVVRGGDRDALRAQVRQGLQEGAGRRDRGGRPGLAHRLDELPLSPYATHKAA